MMANLEDKSRSCIILKPVVFTFIWAICYQISGIKVRKKMRRIHWEDLLTHLAIKLQIHRTAYQLYESPLFKNFIYFDITES